MHGSKENESFVSGSKLCGDTPAGNLCFLVKKAGPIQLVNPQKGGKRKREKKCKHHLSGGKGNRDKTNSLRMGDSYNQAHVKYIIPTVSMQPIHTPKQTPQAAT